MIVRIDDRESKSRQNSAIKFFKKLGYKPVVEHLAVGDFVFHDRICFEYKTASDMIGSIKDGRVFRQARNMTQYEYSFVIVEGSVPHEIDNQSKNAYWKNNSRKYKGEFTQKAWLGAYARLETYSRVLIVETQQQAWKLMDALVSKIFADNTEIKMIDTPQNGLVNPVASYLSCIYVNDTQRLSKATALRITKQYELENVTDLTFLTISDLLNVKGVGQKTAEAIMDAIR